MIVFIDLCDVLVLVLVLMLMLSFFLFATISTTAATFGRFYADIVCGTSTFHSIHLGCVFAFNISILLARLTCQWLLHIIRLVMLVWLLLLLLHTRIARISSSCKKEQKFLMNYSTSKVSTKAKMTHLPAFGNSIVIGACDANDVASFAFACKSLWFSMLSSSMRSM